ncbi:MAG: neutral/alkaline non-lysosomal ceramidase N-terminal domain-containing protein [Candidatus Hydrogenedentes bacterium]|nr:neutral/alkaline non-lysosomal ceramidase N-terminal domain-containing protein [Candidatus Hydrogenedentota bacterium]
MNSLVRLAALLLATCTLHAAQADPAFRVGAGKRVITPVEAMWMAGYASRTAPSDGKIHDLHAKALVIEDAAGLQGVILTTDLIGIPKNIAVATATLIHDTYQIPRERVMITASHTHCGPVMRDNLYGMYALDPEQVNRIEAYTGAMPQMLLDAVTAAMDNLEPATLTWGIGNAGFAVNRREYTPGGVTNGENPIGPVDHDVPVLAARRADGSLKAVLFGYACHNTTLSFQQFCGDYAGFAQYGLEEAFPGATALFATGCGADANPLPRRTLELAQQYGAQLGKAVESVLGGTMAPLNGPLKASFEEIPLELSAPPTREQIEEQLKSEDVYIQRRAKTLLKTLDTRGALDTTYPYPVQIWQFGDALQMTVLGGEVVVDYALLLKHRLGREKQFVIAYANDVCAYIPSLRVLREGGYEGDTSMIYYGFYGPWAPTIQDAILGSALKQTEALKE